MYKRSLEISLVILLFLNLSCATTKNYTEMLDSWIGKNVSEPMGRSFAYLSQAGRDKSLCLF